MRHNKELMQTEAELRDAFRQLRAIAEDGENPILADEYSLYVPCLDGAAQRPAGMVLTLPQSVTHCSSIVKINDGLESTVLHLQEQLEHFRNSKFSTTQVRLVCALSER